jgi:hypothetical protein
LKLTGTKTEQEFEELLARSQSDLMNNPKNKKLLSLLEEEYGAIQTAYVLHWIPEQDTDIYEILINNNLIARVEQDRYESDNKPLISRIEIKNYLKGMSKINQIKFKVAENMAKDILR